MKLGQMPPEPQRWCSRYAAGTESDAMSRLTKWYEPEFKDDDQGTPYVLASDHAALRSYTEDCLARLRVAEKALAWYASEGQQKFFYKDSMRGIFADFTGKAREALAAIGPLPTERSKELP